MSQKSMGILKECIPVFSMLQDENRQQILLMLFDNNELSVTEITERLSLSRPAVSHHLKLLLDSGLVSVRKDGKERCYRINLEPSLSLLKHLVDSIEQDISAYVKKTSDNATE